MNEHHPYQILITGGGIDALCAAIYLLKKEYKVALVTNVEVESEFNEDYYFSESIQEMFESLGIWKAFQSLNPQSCILNYSYWEQFPQMNGALENSPLGWRVAANDLRKFLRQMALQMGLCFYYKHQLQAISFDDDKWDINLQSAEGTDKIYCDWLMDCSGTKAKAAKMLGVKRNYIDRQLAYSALFHCAEDTACADHDIIIEAVDNGWVKNECSTSGLRRITFFTDRDFDTNQRMMENDGLLDLIAKTKSARDCMQQFDYRQMEKLKVSTASSSYLSQLYGKRWIAGGDAAVAFDPICFPMYCQCVSLSIQAADALIHEMDGEEGAMENYATMYINFL